MTKEVGSSVVSSIVDFNFIEIKRLKIKKEVEFYYGFYRTYFLRSVYLGIIIKRNKYLRKL